MLVSPSMGIKPEVGTFLQEYVKELWVGICAVLKKYEQLRVLEDLRQGENPVDVLDRSVKKSIPDKELLALFAASMDVEPLFSIRMESLGRMLDDLQPLSSALLFMQTIAGMIRKNAATVPQDKLATLLAAGLKDSLKANVDVMQARCPNEDLRYALRLFYKSIYSQHTETNQLPAISMAFIAAGHAMNPEGRYPGKNCDKVLYNFFHSQEKDLHLYTPIVLSMHMQSIIHELRKEDLTQEKRKELQTRALWLSEQAALHKTEHATGNTIPLFQRILEMSLDEQCLEPLAIGAIHVLIKDKTTLRDLHFLSITAKERLLEVVTNIITTVDINSLPANPFEHHADHKESFLFETMQYRQELLDARVVARSMEALSVLTIQFAGQVSDQSYEDAMNSISILVESPEPHDQLLMLAIQAVDAVQANTRAPEGYEFSPLIEGIRNKLLERMKKAEIETPIANNLLDAITACRESADTIRKLSEALIDGSSSLGDFFMACIKDVTDTGEQFVSAIVALFLASGNEQNEVLEKFQKLPENDQHWLSRFLRTLKV